MLKFINFVSTPSKTHHKKIKYWQHIACGTTITMLASLSLISALQIKNISELRETIAHQKPFQLKIEDIQQQYNSLSKEKEALLEKTEKWEKYTHHAKKPADIISALRNSTEDKNIHSLRLVRKSVTFQVTVQSAQDGTCITQNLSQSTVFNSVRLTSIKKNSHETIANIECQIKKA